MVASTSGQGEGDYTVGKDAWVECSTSANDRVLKMAVVPPMSLWSLACSNTGQYASIQSFI